MRPPLERGLHVEAAAEEEHLVGVGLWDGAGQAHRAAGEREEAERDFGQAEPGTFVDRADPEVADQRDLKAAAERVAVDRGDQRLLGVELVESSSRRGLEVSRGPSRGGGTIALAQVGAGAEGAAGAGDHGAADLVVVADLVQRIDQLRPERGVDRVEFVGAVERDRGHAFGHVEEDFVCHSPAFRCAPWLRLAG